LAENPNGATPGGPSGPAGVLGPLRATFSSGLTKDLAWRCRQLDGLLGLLGAEEAQLIRALKNDLGRPAAEAFMSDVAAVRAEVRVLRRGLRRWAAPERVRVPRTIWPARARVLREPVGVVLVVAPWNYPVNLVLVPLAAAIAAGNCVVAKPSELAPETSAVLAQLLPRYLDHRGVAVVEGGAEATQSLIGAGVDHVFFTGSPAVGRAVLAAAAPSLTPVTLELGGKSPAIVLGDADLKTAAEKIVWGRFLNAGQTCLAPDFVLVDRRVEADFVAACCTALVRFFGPDPKTSPDYGRLVDERHARRLLGLLESSGGEMAAGGEVDSPARYAAPTLLRNPSPDAPVMQEEIFGPILPIIGIDGPADAIAFLRPRPAPLATYLFTASRAEADALVAATRSGAVCLNATLQHFAVSNLPFGGLGESGSGRYHGRAGYETLSNHRALLERPAWGDASTLAYPPYRRWKTALLRRFL